MNNDWMMRCSPLPALDAWDSPVSEPLDAASSEQIQRILRAMKMSLRFDTTYQKDSDTLLVTATLEIKTSVPPPSISKPSE